ncbi:hypothetical protein IIA79_04125 [bacterium]|nr:hypothetical protein [bacterium]
MRLIPLWLLLLALPCSVSASVADASAAEAAYRQGDYRAAREGFAAAIDAFRNASKDSGDYLVYREAAYLYDRLADCCFTQRDWDSLKLYLDGLLVVGISEQNLIQGQLAGALESGAALATIGYLRDKLDESVRISMIVQLKRSLGLLLLDTQGEGPAAEEAIKQYQALATVMKRAMQPADGAYALDTTALERDVETLEHIYEVLQGLGDIEALWDKFPPESKGETVEQAPDEGQ